MTDCCSRLSKWYILTTNTLFFCLGVASFVLGMIGIKNGFKGSTLFPPNTFQNLIILGVIICIVSILGVINAFVQNKWVIYLYMLIVIASLVLQVMIGIDLYQKAANKASYLSDLWTFSSNTCRSNLQTQFSCCGFQTTIKACSRVTNQSCASKLEAYVSSSFRKMYYFLFAAVSLQLLAMSNSITMICVGTTVDNSNDIRLDYTPTDTSSTKEHLMYHQSNFSNMFSDSFEKNAIQNNRHGN